MKINFAVGKEAGLIQSTNTGFDEHNNRMQLQKINRSLVSKLEFYFSLSL